MSGPLKLIYNSDTWATVTLKKIAKVLALKQALLVRNTNGSQETFMASYEKYTSTMRDGGSTTIFMDNIRTGPFYPVQCKGINGVEYTAIGRYDPFEGRVSSSEVDAVVRAAMVFDGVSTDNVLTAVHGLGLYIDAESMRDLQHVFINFCNASDSFVESVKNNILILCTRPVMPDYAVAWARDTKPAYLRIHRGHDFLLFDTIFKGSLSIIFNTNNGIMLCISEMVDQDVKIQSDMELGEYIAALNGRCVVQSWPGLTSQSRCGKRPCDTMR